MLKSIELITEERNRQISEEGYNWEHDDFELYGQIAKSALVYACPPSARDKVMDFWAWDKVYFKPDTSGTIDGRIRELVKAGALICAEIDRLERLKSCYR